LEGEKEQISTPTSPDFFITLRQKWPRKMRALGAALQAVEALDFPDK
jgi:hypothetical protein